MAFVKKTWKDRIVQYLNRRKLTDVDTGDIHTVTVTRDEGGITEDGDIFNAATMNDLEARIQAAFDSMHPVGSIYMSVNNVNPSTLFGGTWVEWGAGRVPVGVDTTQTEFDTVEETGGEKTHKLISKELPSRAMVQARNNTASAISCPAVNATWTPITVNPNSTVVSSNYDAGNNGIVVWDESTPDSGDKPHNNLQPYITCYMWKRTA